MLLLSGPGLIFGYAGNLAVANQLHEKYEKDLARELANEDSPLQSVGFMFLSFGRFSIDCDLRWQLPDARRDTEKCFAKLASIMNLPANTRIDIETYDTVFREVFRVAFGNFMHEFDGWAMSFRAQLCNMKALALTMEPDEGRRAAMGQHFDVPSAKSLAFDIGVHDQVQGCEAGACIMSRISDVMLLMGDTDKALEYSTEEVYAAYLKWMAHAARRISRGCALARTGSLDAARASLEEAAAMGMQGNHAMLQLRAMEALCLLDVQAGAAQEGTRARLSQILGRVNGSPSEISNVMCDRNGDPTIADLETLIA